MANIRRYITGGEARPGGPQVFLFVDARRLRQANENGERPGRESGLKTCLSALRISVVTKKASRGGFG